MIEKLFCILNYLIFLQNYSIGRIIESKHREILEMCGSGVGQREITRRLSVSLQAVQAALNRHKKGFSTSNIM